MGWGTKAIGDNAYPSCKTISPACKNNHAFPISSLKSLLSELISFEITMLNSIPALYFRIPKITNMKHFFLLTVITMLTMVSCKKEISPTRVETYLENIKKVTRDSMNAADFGLLDFSRVVKTHIDSSHVYLFRIGFKGKSLATDFVLLRADASGNIRSGRIIHLKQSGSEQNRWNGHITLEHLNGEQLLSSPIRDGYVEAFYAAKETWAGRAPLEQDPYVELPEVIIVSTYRNDVFTFYDWYNLLAFFDYSGGGGSTGSSAYYSDSNPYGDGGGGGGSSTTVSETAIEVNYEYQYVNPAIEIAKYMKCFSDIPDAGATGSIELFTDIPVDGDPTRFFDWSNGSPGHVFVQLRKQNGTKSVTQNIGFYPVSGWKTTLTTAPINGKFVDNRHHEFNASIKINLSASQVQTAVTRILYLAGFVRYDIDDYNCTDWALDVFNQAVKPEEMLTKVPRYTIPGGMAPTGTSTPQGIYTRLQQLKSAGGSQAAAITMPIVGWVGTSSGACY